MRDYHKMRVIHLILCCFIVIGFTLPQNISKTDKRNPLQKYLDSMVVAKYGPIIRTVQIFDVDNMVNKSIQNVSNGIGYIFEDPNNQLKGSFIVSLSKYEKGVFIPSDTVFIGILNKNGYVWRSNPIYIESGSITLSGFGDMNSDHTTDILFSTKLDMRGLAEALWIITPNDSEGNYLNEIDDDGVSKILGASDGFSIYPQSEKGIKTIKALKFDTNKIEYMLYTWNGKVFTKQNHSKIK